VGDTTLESSSLKSLAANNALPKVRAGHWHIGCKSLSALVPAGRFQLSFCNYLVLHIFNLALAPGGTSIVSLRFGNASVSVYPFRTVRYKKCSKTL